MLFSRCSMFHITQTMSFLCVHVPFSLFMQDSIGANVDSKYLQNPNKIISVLFGDWQVRGVPVLWNCYRRGGKKQIALLCILDSAKFAWKGGVCGWQSITRKLKTKPSTTSSPADKCKMWANCAFHDKSVKLGTKLEDILTNIFSYRAIVDVSRDPSCVRILSNVI